MKSLAYSLLLCIALGMSASAGWAQDIISFGSSVNSPQATTFVLAPDDGSAAEVLRRAGVDTRSNSAAVASVTSGVEYGRPDLSSAIDLSHTIGSPDKAPLTVSVTGGFDYAGDAVRSAFGLPGDRQSTYLAIGLGSHLAPTLLVSADISQSAGGALTAPQAAAGLNVNAAVANRLVVTGSGLSAVGGAAGGVGSIGMIWQPFGGWAISSALGFGSSHMLPMIATDSPDEQPSRLQLSISAPICDGMSLRLGFRAGFLGAELPAVSSLPFTAIITRNM